MQVGGQVNISCLQILRVVHARLSLLGRTLSSLEAVKAECLEAGAGEVITLRCDVSVEAECEAAVAATVAQLGGLDILVNNAGHLARDSFSTVTLATLDTR